MTSSTELEKSNCNKIGVFVHRIILHELFSENVEKKRNILKVSHNIKEARHSVGKRVESFILTSPGASFG